MEGPTTPLTFLGIDLDTHHMEIHLPGDELHRIQQEMLAWLHKKATKREIFSLVDLLQQARKVVKRGRTFVARMYQTVPFKS